MLNSIYGIHDLGSEPTYEGWKGVKLIDLADFGYAFRAYL